MRKRIPPEVKQQCIAMYKEGATLASIRGELELYDGQIYAILAAEHIELRRPINESPKDIDVEEFATDYFAGMPIMQICHKYGISINKFYSLAEKLKLPRRNLYGRVTKETSEKVLALDDQKLPIYKIAVECGISSATVYKILDENGRPRRRSRDTEYDGLLEELKRRLPIRGEEAHPLGGGLKTIEGSEISGERGPNE